MVCIGLSINGLEYSIISCQDANREIAIAAITPSNNIFDFDRLYQESGDRYHEGRDNIY